MGPDQEQLGDYVPHNDPRTVALEIERRILGPDGLPSGYVKRVGTRRLRDILEDMERMLRSELGDIEYLKVAASLKPGEGPEATWPEDWRWVASYAVTGDSEGHYIHVDVVLRDGTRRMVFIGKTFGGMDHALKVANACAKVLGA